HERGFADGFYFRHASPLELVRKLHNEDAVFRNQADERDETDFGVNVQRGRPAVREERNSLAGHFQETKHERTEHRERHGTEQDDEWIAEAVELRGEHEENQHGGKGKHRKELAAFGA